MSNRNYALCFLSIQLILFIFVGSTKCNVCTCNFTRNSYTGCDFGKGISKTYLSMFGDMFGRNFFVKNEIKFSEVFKMSKFAFLEKTLSQNHELMIGKNTSRVAEKVSKMV